MEKPTYKLESFEGPMDLLLHLISRHKLEITDVPILDLVEQYLDYVRQLQEENLDIASEFLEMAARLVYIKTVTLLPVHEEGELLTEELRGELLEYQDCKQMANRLAQMANGMHYYARKPEEMPVDMQYQRRHEPVELLRYYLSAVGKSRRRLPPPVEAFSGIMRHIVSVSSRIQYVMQHLRKKRQQKFSALFRTSASRSEMIATFLAILSLAKSKSIAFTGEGEDLTVVFVKEGEAVDEFGA